MKTFLFTCCFILLSLVLPAQKISYFWMLSDSIGLEFDFTGLKRQFKTNAHHFIPFPGIYDNQVVNSAHWDDELGIFVYHDGVNIYNNKDSLIQNLGQLDRYTLTSLMLPLNEKGDSLMLFRNAIDRGFTYSIIYIDSLENVSMGRKNVFISQDTFCNKFMAIRHANNRDWWVITHQFGNNHFWVLLIEKGRIQKIEQIAIGAEYLDYLDVKGFPPKGQLGYINVNKTSDRIVCVSRSGAVDVFDFNRCTGNIHNHISLKKPRTHFPYPVGQYSKTDYLGCSFSPDDRFVYVSCHKYLLQYDLKDLSVESKPDTIFFLDRDYPRDKEVNHIPGPQGYGLFQHYVGKDDKIYIYKTLFTPFGKSNSPFDSTLAVIHEPNKKGAACRFELNAIPLQFGARTKAGMYAPTYSPDEPLKAGISASDTVVCVGDSVQFFNNSCGQLSHEWRLDGWQSDTSQNPIRKYIKPGIYKTRLLLTTYRPAGITHLEITVRVKDCLKADFSTKTVESDTCGQVWVQYIPEIKQGTPNYMEWDFGDGQTSNEISPLHLYTQIGTFKPTLKVRNTDDEVIIHAVEKITVEPCPTEPQEFKLYPNPNNGTFTLEYVTQETQHFEVFNVLGQLIARIPIHPKLKRHELTLDVAEGVYFYRVNLPSGKYVSGKLMIME